MEKRKRREDRDAEKVGANRRVAGQEYIRQQSVGKKREAQEVGGRASVMKLSL